MREVNRNAVIKPSCLDVDLNKEVESVRTTGKINNAIYGDESVKKALKTLYKDKCFLCECSVLNNEKIEHFLPWSKIHPERSYDWNNLNLSCHNCNTRKIQKKYKIINPSNGSDVLDMNLIDPSQTIKLDKLFDYNKNRKVIALDTTNQKCVLTAEFLNDSNCIEGRNNRWDELTEILFKSSDERKIWEAVLIQNPYNFPSDGTKITILKALERADSIFQLFLSEYSPYSMCIKKIIFEYTGISFSDFVKLSGYYRSQH